MANWRFTWKPCTRLVEHLLFWRFGTKKLGEIAEGGSTRIGAFLFFGEFLGVRGRGVPNSSREGPPLGRLFETSEKN